MILLTGVNKFKSSSLMAVYSTLSALFLRATQSKFDLQKHLSALREKITKNI